MRRVIHRLLVHSLRGRWSSGPGPAQPALEDAFVEDEEDPVLPVEPDSPEPEPEAGAEPEAEEEPALESDPEPAAEEDSEVPFFAAAPAVSLLSVR